MSHDDDTQSAPGPSSKPSEDVAAGSESPKKRKFIEDPRSEELNPPPKRKKGSGRPNANAPQATPQATTNLLPPPVFSGWVQENGQRKPRRPRGRKRSISHPVVAQPQGDSMGNVYGPPQMYSSQGRECDASVSSSISNVPTTSVYAQGMGRRQTSKPDLKGKRKAEDCDLYSADAPQPRTSGSEFMPSPDEIFRQAEKLFGDKQSAAILTALHSMSSQTLIPPSRYFEILNPNPPVSIVLPEATVYLQQTILRNHTKILCGFFINILIHFCSSISDIPGVLFSGPTGKVAALLTDEDVAILRDRLMRFQNNMNPQNLSCPSPVSIPDEMCHPKTTLLLAYPLGDHFMIRVFPVTPAPAIQNQLPESLYATASSLQSSSRQVPAQRSIPPQDRLSTLHSQNASLPTSNYGQLGLGLVGVQAQQQLDYSSGMGLSLLSPLPLRVPSPLPLNLPVFPTPGPSVSGGSSSTTPRRTPLPLPLSQVGVSHLSRRSTPAPQPMGMNTANTAFSSPHPYAQFLQIPETPTTGVPFISQSLSSAAGPGTPGGFDYSVRESAGGGGATPAAATPAAATPAAVEGYEARSGSYDPDAWLLRYARVRRGGVERVGPVWGVPLRHVQEIREMTGEEYARRYGSGSGLGSVGGVVEGSAGTVTSSHGEDYLHPQTTTTATAMAGFSNLEHVTDGTPMLPQLFSDSEGGLLMQAAAYDVAGRMDGSGLYPLLANSNSVVSRDEHANDASGSGTMALPQLLASGSDVLDDAVSILQRISNDSDGPSSLSGSLGNDVNPPTTDALPDMSSSSNARVADVEDAPSSSSSVVVAAEFAGLAERLSELDSWIATSPFAVSGQSGVVDDGNWFNQFFPGFDESTVL